jgi:hypothetical protein
MATVLNTLQNKQGVLSIGSNTMHVAPSGYYCEVTLRFNNPVAYDISLSITRASLSSTEQIYSISLDAGDTVEDSGYLLNPGDRIVVDTTTAGTVYSITITNTIYTRTT